MYASRMLFSMRRIEPGKNTARIERVVRFVPIRAEAEKLTQLSRQGRGPCPLMEHSSKDCFSVVQKNPLALPMFYCFACGEGGNVITLYAKAHKIPFLEALTALEAIYGLTEDKKAFQEIEARIRRERRLKAEAEHRRTLELLDVQLGMILIQNQQADLGDFYRGLLSYDEMDRLSQLADQWAVLWARFEELMAPVQVYVSEWKQRCREIADEGNRRSY